MEFFKGYTIETVRVQDRNPYAQAHEVEYMYYPTEQGIQHDADCTDDETYSYCGNCNWAPTTEDAKDDIERLTAN